LRQILDGSDWHGSQLGAFKIELLPESLNERWVAEECPGRLAAKDSEQIAMRRN
jgi:hypothetical protein